MLVVDLGKWMNKILIDWGIDPTVADRFDETIIAILMIAIAIGLNYLCQAILIGGMRQYTRRKPHQWNTLLMKRKVFHNLIHTIPAFLVYYLLPIAFVRGKDLLLISQKACAIYIIFSLLLAVNGILLMIMDIYDGKESMKNRPMKGFIQVLQVLLFFIGGIIIIAIIVNKSPASLFAGLGASAAILMLVFKDSILGFVAGIQLSANDMVRPGDWITLPSGAANGTVQEITLNTVKIQNFDNTIVTIPPYSLVSGSFINWRGMTESGGRRIMREYALKLDYIQPCTPEFLEKMKKFDADLADFITEKQKQAAEGKVANTDNPAGLVNGTIDTNVGLLRAYMTLYLKRHPFISKDLLLMVRTLAPTENGLPVQIYCFSSNKNWPSYESIQAEIMEHFVSVLPEFGLYPFQNPTARDYVISGLIESGKDLSTVDGIPWHSVLPKEEKV